MLHEHTINQLRSLRLDGMVRAIEDQASSAAATALGCRPAEPSCSGSAWAYPTPAPLPTLPARP